MSKIVLVRNVEIYGKPYAQDDDISGVDPGVVQSLVSVGWAREVKDEAPVEVSSEKTSKKKKS